MRNNIFVASTLANDPHTEGLYNAARIAELGGVKPIILEPSVSIDCLCDTIHKYYPKYIGLSYRLTPKTAVEQLEKTLSYFQSSGLISNPEEVKITFAGLPETINILRDRVKSYPYKIYLCEPYPDILDRAKETVEFFDIVKGHDRILEKLKEELKPKGIEILDQLADAVILNDNYKAEPPLQIPSNNGINSYTSRIAESPIPLLRSHFGIPAPDVNPTVEGIAKLAEACVLDELSLGSSDLSQRYFGHPEMFVDRKNDGGVPYKTIADLRKLYQASRRGNFPSVKPYCHVNDIVNFVDQCIEIGLLKGGHQAIPLFWFNELDGRGSKTVRESIHEHFAGVRQLVKHSIPVEMNDPNQWSSRLAHDTLIVTSYALIASVMAVCGVKDMVFQMQFNKPKETGDYGDLAKMMAGMEIAKKLTSYVKPNIIRETRAGIEHLSPNMNMAKWQLARTTLLQMLLQPQVIHIVSYCEANYAARPEDIIDSSRLIRRAIRVFNENKSDILSAVEWDIVNERKSYLLSETEYLLHRIAKFNPRYIPTPTENLAQYLGNPDVIADSIEHKIMASPGIVNKKYKANYLTKALKYGMVNAVDGFVTPRIITESERLSNNEE